MTSIRSEKLWGIMRSEKVTRGPRAIRETNRPPNPAIILLTLLSPIATPGLGNTLKYKYIARVFNDNPPTLVDSWINGGSIPMLSLINIHSVLPY
jgi:hypothetical protein